MTPVAEGGGMKRGTIRHPKLVRLARRLEREPFAALGLLEALLDWSYQFARRGDVGRFADEDIAEAVGWTGDAHALIESLVDTRWLDRCPRHRLVIHDLADHADRTWKQTLDRAHETFVSPQCVLSEDSVRTQCVLSESSVRTQRDTLKPPARPEPEPDLISLATLAPTPAAGFDDFWQRYPLHVGKQAARKAWSKLGPSPPLGSIVDALAWQRELPRWREEGGRFVPHPATYLNGRRWEDERPPDPVAEIIARLKAEKAQAQ